MGTLGLVLWLIAQAMGLLIAGAGHGWGGAFLFSLPLAILYPLALIRIASPVTGSHNADVGLMAAAIVLDLFLLGSTSGDEYFMKVWRFDPTFVAIWIAIWAGWQVPFVASLFWKALSRSRAESV